MSLTSCVCDVPTQARSQAQIAIFALIVALSSLGDFGCFAQSAAASCNEVHAYASVLNSKGQMAYGLDVSNFQAEIGGSPAQVKSSEQNPQRHRAVVLIDHSGSMAGGGWAVAREVALDFVNQLPSSVPVAVFVFDDTVRPVAGLGDERRLVMEAMQRLFQGDPPKGRTKFYDAIDAGLQALQSPVTGDFIFTITDGGDNRSDADAARVRKKLITSGVGLSALMLTYGEDVNMTAEERIGLSALREIVEQTGVLNLTLSASKGIPGWLTKDLELDREDISHLGKNAAWLAQNLTDGYELTLVPGHPLTKPAKLNLRVSIPIHKVGDRFRVLTQGLVAARCE